MRRTSNNLNCKSEDSCAKLLNCTVSHICEDHVHNTNFSYCAKDSADRLDSAISIDNELHSDCEYCFCLHTSHENMMNTTSESISAKDIHEDLRKKLSLTNKLKSSSSSTTDSGLGVDVFSSSSEIDIQCNDKTTSIEESEENLQLSSNDNQQTFISLQWRYIFQRDEDGDTILHMLVVKGFYKAISALIQLIPESSFLNITNKLWQTPLHLAVLTDQPHIVRRFVVAGALLDLQDHNGNTPLHLACATGKLSCVKALIVPITEEEIKEARIKYSLSHSYKIPRLLERKNFEGLSCIHLATLGRHTKVIRYLVVCGADINAQEGKSGRTPLHYATECQKIDLVHFLLSKCNANGRIKNYAGFTPQHVALFLNKLNPSSKIYLKLTGLLKQHCGDIFDLPMSESDSDGEYITDQENDYNCQYLFLCP